MCTLHVSLLYYRRDANLLHTFFVFVAF